MFKNKMMTFALVCSTFIGGSTVGAHADHAKTLEVSVVVNGVPVPSSHSWKGKTYVSVSQFAKLFDKKATSSKDGKTIEFNGKTITDLRLHHGEMTAWVQEMASAVHAQGVQWDPVTGEVYVLALPEGTVQITPTVPAMGEHWSNPQAGDLPMGPIYGVQNGKLVFVEYMSAQEDFINGKNHLNLAGMKGVPSPSVVQTDIELQPNGHEGFENPHYDIHAYFITDEEQQKIQ